MGSVYFSEEKNLPETKTRRYLWSSRFGVEISKRWTIFPELTALSRSVAGKTTIGSTKNEVRIEYLRLE